MPQYVKGLTGFWKAYAMNKVTYFRKCIQEQYACHNLVEAAVIGESLISEFIACDIDKGASFADDLYNLAVIYDEMGLNEKAIGLYTASVNHIIQINGGTGAITQRLMGLAALLSKQGNVDGAYWIFLHASLVANLSYGRDDPQLADAMYNLANAAADAGKDEEAISLQLEALSIYKEIGSVDDIVLCMHSIASIYETKNEHEQAVKYAADAMEQAYGTDDYYQACFYLAELYESEKNHTKSKPLYEKVLNWVVSAVGQNNSAYINVATKLSYTMAGLGDYTGALSLMYTVYNSLNKKPTAGNLCFASCLRNLSMLHNHAGEKEKAADFMLKSIRIKNKILGKSTSEQIQDLISVIEIYIENNQVKSALDVLVLLLMTSDENDLPGPLEQIATLFVKKGYNSIGAITNQLEGLTEAGALSDIIKAWENPEI